MSSYKGIPKKRKVYVDESGRFVPLDVNVDLGDVAMLASSGTLSAGGTVTITGSYFKPTSVVNAVYNKASAGTAPLAVAVTDGTATFKGDNSAKFFFTVINL